MRKIFTVALLDVMGFADKIESSQLIDIGKKYKKFVTDMKLLNQPLRPSPESKTLFPNHPKGKPWCWQTVISDSIILISEDDSLDSFMKLILYVWRFSQYCLCFDMPVRGAVTFGEMFVDRRENITIGKPLTKAHKLEKEQNWIGIVIDDTVVDSFPDFFSNLNDLWSMLLYKYNVPFKKEKTKNMHTINWRFNFKSKKGTKLLFSTDGPKDVMEKIENTLKYAKEIVKTKKVYISGDVPNELVTFLCGPQPSFEHGDDL